MNANLAAGSSYTALVPSYSITLLIFDIVPRSQIFRNAIVVLLVIGVVLLYFRLWRK